MTKELKDKIQQEASIAAKRRYPSWVPQEGDSDFEFNMQESCQQEVSDVFTEGANWMHQQYVVPLEEALQNLLNAIPKQTEDSDFWEDDLTNAVEKARQLIK
jgi:hypothetical protein